MPRGQPYQYKPLREQRSIRILEVLPFERRIDRSGTTSVDGRMKEVSFDEAPNYEAVSYRWDEAASSRKFHCDDGYLKLTENCWRMIRFMRLKNRSRFLWIDACCIDQNSEEERNHQVGMMGDVYSKARRVLVWLGYPGPSVDYNKSGIMRFIRKIGQERSEAQFDQHDIKRLYQFFTNPWFSRVWTVQEFALAPACVIMYGFQWFAAEDLVAVFSLRQGWRDVASIDHRQNVELEGFERFSLHHDLWKHIRHTRNQESFVPVSCTRLLLRVRSQRATDPKDKIFAFQGILAQLSITLPAPDYSKTTEKIYREGAAACILQDNDLMLLSSLTGIVSLNLGGKLPSWVPDWSIEYPISEVASWDSQRATHSDPPIFRFSQDGKRLTLHGMIIDTIDVVSSAFPTSYNLRERAGERETYSARMDEIRVLKEWFNRFGSLRDPLAASFADFARDAWTRTYAGVCPDADTLDLYWIQCILQLRSSHTIDSDLRRKIDATWGDPKHQGVTDLCLAEIKQSIIQFHAIIRKLSDRKVIFRTYGGNFGVGSSALKLGDKIALFSGCNLPMIIRPLRNHWWMSGPAYVQHAMQNCEAWTSGGYLREDYTFA